METYFGISEVCKKFDITSRTLRYYEKEGLIASFREKETLPRKYTEEEVERLRKILIMRSLNLSIKDIKELFLSDQDISIAIRSKMAVIKTELNEKEKQLRNLERAVTLIRENQDIFKEEDIIAVKNRQTEIAWDATQKLIDKEYDNFVEYFAPHLRKYLTLGFLKAFAEDMKELIGKLYKITECLPVEDIIHVYIACKERTLLVKYLFHNEFLVAFTFDSLSFDGRM